MRCRLRIVKEISDISQQIGYEDTKKHILKPISEFARDQEGAVLQALAEQLPYFCSFFLKVCWKKKYPMAFLLMDMVAWRGRHTDSYENAFAYFPELDYRRAPSGLNSGIFIT